MRASRLGQRRATVQAGLLLVASLVCLGARAAGASPTHPLLQGCGNAPTPACVDRLEARALKAPLARREAGVLRLSLGQGEPQLLADAANGSLRYRYLGPLAGTDLQLVATVTPMARAGFVLVGTGVSGALRLPAAPWPSPGGLLFAVAASAQGDEPGGLQLWHRVGSQWRLLMRFDPPPGMGFEVQGWRADGAALHLGWECPGHRGTTQLRDGPFGWDLVPQPPPACP
jgi:hypothetical protein